MEGHLKAWRHLCAFVAMTALVVAGNVQMAALRRMGASPPGANEFAQMGGFVENLRNALIWIGTGVAGLLFVGAAILIVAGESKGAQRLGLVALGVGLLLSTPGIMA